MPDIATGLKDHLFPFRLAAHSPAYHGLALVFPGQPDDRTTPAMTGMTFYDIIFSSQREETGAVMIGINEMRVKLEELRSEHRDLDDVIRQLSETSPFNQLQIQRLKKRKLALKDQIIQLESKLLPDIIA
jgi:hypothetical protein